jgi:hypothetical protein
LFKKTKKLRSGSPLALGKILFKKRNFAECLCEDTRQNRFKKNKKKIAECRPLGTRQNLMAGGRRDVQPPFAECRPGLGLFCRVRHSAKHYFAECLDKKHSAKPQALDKVLVSRSASCTLK